MASCTLTIELEEPNRVYRGGETVRGHLLVQANKRVQCNGLTVKSIWETHGKGNVDTGVWREVTLDSGVWEAGFEKRYPFQLECASWPPTYHGTYVHIDHYIAAQVDVPWALDPKAKQPFQVAPSGNPDAEQLEGMTKRIEAGPVMKAIGIAIICVVCSFLIFHPCAWIILLVAGIWAFFTKYLPKQKLGEIEFKVHTPRVVQGETLKADLTLKPGGNTEINGINYAITAAEFVVRGHGTDRKTYTHPLIDSKGELAGQGKLTGGEENAFSIAYPIPSDAPYSFKLDDNKLVWTVAVHVDIPRWPDWKKSEEFEVILPGDGVPPSTNAGTNAPSQSAKNQSDGQSQEHRDRKAKTTSNHAAQPTAPSSGVSFADTCELVSKVRTDFEQLERVLSAVANQAMPITVRLHRRMSSGAVDDEMGYDNGHIYEGDFEEQQILVFAPDSRVDELNAKVGSTWNGVGTIVGYDRTIGSLRIKVQ